MEIGDDDIFTPCDNLIYSERIDSVNTPNGGKYSIAFFSDENGNPCTKDKAVHAHIHIYNEKDELICTVY